MAKDGKKIFDFITDTHSPVDTTPVVRSDGVVILGSTDHKLYWLKDGATLAEFEARQPFVSSPALLANGVVVVAPHDGHVYWLSDGRKLFDYEIGTEIQYSSPIVLSDGTIVIQTFGAGILWLKDGKLRFRVIDAGNETKDAGSTYSSSSPVSLKDDSVVANTKKGLFWLRDGKVVHAYRHPEFDGNLAAMADGSVVAASSSEKSLYWLKDGTLKCKVRIEDLSHFPPLAIADNLVAVGTMSGHLLVLNGGKKILDYNANAPIYPLAALTDGTIIAASRSKLLWLRVASEKDNLSARRTVGSFSERRASDPLFDISSLIEQPGMRDRGRLFDLRFYTIDEPLVTIKDVASATSEVQCQPTCNVVVVLSAAGISRMKEELRARIGQSIGIVFKGKIQSAAYVHTDRSKDGDRKAMPAIERNYVNAATYEGQPFEIGPFSQVEATKVAEEINAHLPH